ncbi:hypothetical protein RCL1_004899 [Eukaryota sp. TZLM3-RCL]
MNCCFCKSESPQSPSTFRCGHVLFCNACSFSSDYTCLVCCVTFTPSDVIVLHFLDVLFQASPSSPSSIFTQINTQSYSNALLDAALNALPSQSQHTQSTMLATQLPSSNPESSFLPSIVTKPVILITGFDQSTSSSLSHLVTSLEGIVSSSFSPVVTHVVISINKHGLARRTIKFLQAVVSNKIIISQGWLTKSHEAGHFVDESLYIVKGDVAESEGGLIAFRSFRAKTGPIFRGFAFFVFHTYSSLSSKDLCSLIQAAGGFVIKVDTSRECFRFKKTFDARKYFLLVCSEFARDEDNKSFLSSVPSQIPIILLDWFLRCCSLNSVVAFDRYKLVI